MMKRIIICLIAAAFLLSAAGCGNAAPSAAEASASAAVPDSSAEELQEQAETPEQPDENAPISAMEAEESAVEEPAEDLLPYEVLPEVSIADSKVDYPIYDEMETFSVVTTANSLVLSALPVKESFNASFPTEYIEADTHVHLDFTVWNDSAARESLQLMIASGTYPDLWGTSLPDKTGSTIERLIDEEVVLDVADLLEENAPEIYALMKADKNYAKDLVGQDGSIGAIVGRSLTIGGTSGGLYIRQDMLDKMGIEIDRTKHMSTDEMTDILRAAKSEFGCRLALLVLKTLECGMGNSFNVVDEGLSSYVFSYQLKEPGKTDIQCSMTSSNFRDYISFLRGYYEEGLICDDYTGVAWALGTADQWCLSNNCCIFYNSTNLPAMISVMELSDPDYNAVAIPDPYYYEGMTIGVEGGGAASMGRGVSLSPQCHDPEGMLKYLNYFFCKEGRTYTNYGVEGVSWEYDDDGEIVYTDFYLNNPDYGIATREQMFKVFWGAPMNIYYHATELQYNDEQMEILNTWALDRGANLTIPGYYFTSEENAELAATENDISTYFYERIFEAVVGDITMEEWDNCVEEAYNMGLGRCEELYQIATDRYIERIGW